MSAWVCVCACDHPRLIPPYHQITNITGGLLTRTFGGGRSERNEYLLCHEFHRRKLIVPDRPSFQGAPPPPEVCVCVCESACVFL